MGYANPAQLTSGIHTRLFSRAFIFDDGTNTAVFVSVDCGMIDQIVKTEVSEIKKMGEKLALVAVNGRPGRKRKSRTFTSGNSSYAFSQAVILHLKLLSPQIWDLGY